MQIEKVFIQIENPGNGLFWLLWCLLPWWLPALVSATGLQTCKQADTNLALWSWGLQVALAGFLKGYKRFIPLYSRTLIGVNNTCLCIEASSDLGREQVLPKKNEIPRYTMEEVCRGKDEIEEQDCRIEAWAQGF